MTPHHITRITAENFMRLKAVDISPDGNIVYITGANGEGKSSVLNAICAALNWRDAASSIPEPIHKGEKKAVVTIDLGDMLITRTWTSSGTQLKVESKDGAKYPTPQAMLDQFFRRIGFDPLEFIRMQPRDQRQTLMDLLGIDFSQYDLEKSDLLREKLSTQNQLTGLQQQLMDMPDVPEVVPDQEISAGDLIQKIQDAKTIAMDLDHKQEELYRKNMRMGEIVNQIESLQTELQTLEREHSCLFNLVGTIQVPDIDSLQEQLTNIETINKQVRQKQQAFSIRERLQQAEKTVEDLSESIKDIDQDKRDALESAKFPVKGLTFDESGVLFQGVSLKQASSAEQIRVSLAIGIAMNPALKFMIIRDGSLLDTKSRELVADMAAKHDMQVFIEAVDESGKMGFVIEDGTVRVPVESGQQVLA